MKTKQKLILCTALFCLLGGRSLHAAEPSVQMVVAGKMAVADNGTTSLLVDGSVRTNNLPNQVVEVAINQAGKTAITGNFVHDADGHAFDAVFASGVVSFTDKGIQTKQGKRKITATDIEDNNVYTTFKRTSNYITFPSIEIDIDSNLIIPGHMGIDALSIKRSKKGRMYLESVPCPTNEKAYDASLRLGSVDNQGEIVSTGTADKGSVVVERYVGCYRKDAKADCLLFPFASPYKSLRAGNFVGQWVRKVKVSDDGSQHVQYYSADDPDANGNIEKSRYLIDLDDVLEPAIPHFITLKGKTEIYDQNDLAVQLPSDPDEMGSVFKAGKYAFDGCVYTKAEDTEKEIFAGEALFSGSAVAGKAINWVIGNSYTAALSLKKIADRIDNSQIAFYDGIWIYRPSSTCWERYKVSDYINGISPGALAYELPQELPSMSVFMLRIHPSNTEDTEVFSIGKECLVHSDISHGINEVGYEVTTRSAFPVYQDEVQFNLCVSGNMGISDRVLIGLRSGTEKELNSMNVPKHLNAANEVFNLYTCGADNAALSIRALPKETTSAPIYLKPATHAENYTLTWTRFESLENIWLEDLVTGISYDLNEMDEISFTVKSGEPEKRFLAHFTPRQSTSIGGSDFAEALRLRYYADRVYVEGIQACDKGSVLSISDIQGRLLSTVKLQPEDHSFDVSDFTSGVYVAKIVGKRDALLKFNK